MKPCDGIVDEILCRSGVEEDGFEHVGDRITMKHSLTHCDRLGRNNLSSAHILTHTFGQDQTAPAIWNAVLAA